MMVWATTVGLWGNAILAAMVVYPQARTRNPIWAELRTALAVVTVAALWVVLDGAL